MSFTDLDRRVGVGDFFFASVNSDSQVNEAKGLGWGRATKWKGQELGGARVET